MLGPTSVERVCAASTTKKFLESGQFGAVFDMLQELLKWSRASAAAVRCNSSSTVEIAAREGVELMIRSSLQRLLGFAFTGTLLITAACDGDAELTKEDESSIRAKRDAGGRSKPRDSEDEDEDTESAGDEDTAGDDEDGTSDEDEKLDAGPGPSNGASGDIDPEPGPKLGATDDSSLWCGARAVLQSRCQNCHGAEVAGAPMSLVTHADTQANSVLDESKKVSELIKARVNDERRPMPPVAQGPLTAEEKAALNAWADAGYPGGTCSTPDVPTDKPSDEFQWPAECTPDKIFKIQAHQNGQPYDVPANWEDNVTITIPVPWAGKFSGEVQAVAIRPLTNNKRVVHHWILFAGTLSFITSWSPGKPAEVFPEDVGVYMPTSGDFRLNMHYYNQGNNSAEKDESGAEICITDKLRPKTATTNMFGPLLLLIPPGESEAVATCTHGGSEPVTLITSSPHMHKTGVRGKFEIIRANGKVEVLDDTPFNQEDQTVRPINAVLMPGDQVRTTCYFENDTNGTITFGESTNDEMCFNFSRYYPMGALQCSALGF